MVFGEPPRSGISYTLEASSAAALAATAAFGIMPACPPLLAGREEWTVHLEGGGETLDNEGGEDRVEGSRLRPVAALPLAARAMASSSPPPMPSNPSRSSRR